MNQKVRTQMGRLYYLIRKAHVQLLDPRMREIADPMLAQEFRLHLDNSDEKFTAQFIEKWVEYYEHITSIESIEQLGKNLSEDEKALLTQEQKENIDEIKKLVQNN